MDKTKGQGQNMNALFIEMGYSGIDDPEFKEDDIQKSYLPFGAIGMLGDGSHNYVYSILVVPGKQKLDCWKINAKDADHNDLYFMSDCGNAFYNTNDLYFMSDCGNAFYNTNPGAEPAAMATAPAAAPEKKPADMEIKVYARYKPEPCNCCASYGDDMGNEWNYDKEEKTLLSKQKVEPMQVSENNVIVVQEVYIDVDKATYKKLKKHDTVVKYESRTEMDTSKMYSKK
jgi:hypothetical protein